MGQVFWYHLLKVMNKKRPKGETISIIGPLSSCCSSLTCRLLPALPLPGHHLGLLQGPGQGQVLLLLAPCTWPRRSGASLGQRGRHGRRQGLVLRHPVDVPGRGGGSGGHERPTGGVAPPRLPVEGGCCGGAGATSSSCPEGPREEVGDLGLLALRGRGPAGRCLCGPGGGGPGALAVVVGGVAVGQAEVSLAGRADTRHQLVLLAALAVLDPVALVRVYTSLLLLWAALENTG